jgi:hypothetical protein
MVSITTLCSLPDVSRCPEDLVKESFTSAVCARMDASKSDEC